MKCGNDGGRGSVSTCAVGIEVVSCSCAVVAAVVFAGVVVAVVVAVAVVAAVVLLLSLLLFLLLLLKLLFNPDCYTGQVIDPRSAVLRRSP